MLNNNVNSSILIIPYQIILQQENLFNLAKKETPDSNQQQDDLQKPENSFFQFEHRILAAICSFSHICPQNDGEKTGHKMGVMRKPWR